MENAYTDILNPVGLANAQPTAARAERRAGGAGRVVGLLNNSKPNVGYFLEAVEDELRRHGNYEVVNVTKPRSAAPLPDLERLASRCDAVVNAVAD